MSDVANSSFALGIVESELMKHGTYASVTRGPSMKPLFKTSRDMVIISRVERPLKKYDVVIYRGGNSKYTMHRIIRVCENEYLIRGDNTYRIEHIPKENIIGILTEFNRKGKKHSVEERGYKIYSRIWNFIYPVRHVCHAVYAPIYRLLAKIYRKLFKK